MKYTRLTRTLMRVYPETFPDIGQDYIPTKAGKVVLSAVMTILMMLAIIVPLVIFDAPTLTQTSKLTYVGNNGDVNKTLAIQDINISTDIVENNVTTISTPEVHKYQFETDIYILESINRDYTMTHKSRDKYSNRMVHAYFKHNGLSIPKSARDYSKSTKLHIIDGAIEYGDILIKRVGGKIFSVALSIGNDLVVTVENGVTTAMDIIIYKDGGSVITMRHEQYANILKIKEIGSKHEQITWLKNQVGKPYVWGSRVTSASSEMSYDCSSLSKKFMEKCGKHIARTASGQYANATIHRDSEYTAGDLLFYNDPMRGKIGHVAIYIGDGMVVEAKGKDYGVIVSSVRTKNFKGYMKGELC